MGICRAVRALVPASRRYCCSSDGEGPMFVDLQAGAPRPVIELSAWLIVTVRGKLGYSAPGVSVVG